MQKYCIVHFVEPLPDGYEFVARNNWPLHITLASNFTLPYRDEEFINKLAEICSRFEPITVAIDGEAFFGKDQSVHVSLVAMTDELRTLHRSIVEILEASGAVFDEPQYHLDGYRAHATIQVNSRLNSGDSVIIDSATLVDMFPNEDISRRKLLKTISFS
jgi:2'-5' RNA ligase